jgi:hypothetical protein
MRRAAGEAGAPARMAGTGGGYAATGGYPIEFLRGAEIELTVTRLRGRVLHWFPFQLNMSSPVHRITQPNS